MKRLARILILLMITCASCKVSDRINISRDPEMHMGIDAGHNFNNYVHGIREGGIPAASAKSSGGCGCN